MERSRTGHNSGPEELTLRFNTTDIATVKQYYRAADVGLAISLYEMVSPAGGCPACYRAAHPSPLPSDL